MRKHLFGAALGAVAVVAAMSIAGSAGAAGGGGKPYSLALSGAKEFDANGVAINPHGDADRGSVKLTLNSGKGRICWTFGAITLTAGEALPHLAHIHEAPAGKAGPVVVNIFGTPDSHPAPTAYPTDTKCVNAPRALVKEIRQNPDEYYINLHNTTHGAGVMRAQLSD